MPKELHGYPISPPSWQNGTEKIHIADFQSTYLPGDVIIGHVATKKAFGRGPRVDQTVVKVSLFGCARTEIVGGPDKTTHLGQAVLVDEEQCIFRGAVSAESRFPFVVTIPKTPQPAVAKTGDSWDKLHEAQQGDRVVGQDMKFLSNTQEDITTHALPAVFYFEAKRASIFPGWEASVEYVLKAELTCPGASDARATFPLLVRAQSIPKPVDYSQYSFNIDSFHQTTRSERLLAQNRDKQISLLERSRRLFTPSKVPSYSYNITVATPPVIQLDHPAPVPLKVHVAPLMEQNKVICPDGDVRRLPPIELISVDLKLVSLTRVRVPGDHIRQEETTYPIPIDQPIAMANYNIPVVIRGNLRDKEDVQKSAGEPDASFHSKVRRTWTQERYMPPQKMRSYSLGSPLDLGDSLDLRLSETECSTLGGSGRPTKFEKRLWPSFATYNIIQAYELAWKIKIACVGEMHTTEGRANVGILPPSEDQATIKDYGKLMAASGLTTDVDSNMLDMTK
ncbi:hypothetical protein BJ166DRAFT_587397 [Pestalotiopsis sp. NC0098]|nr:hypothetical protein BJ166DRAFT_587397 [Pestalotiopsis sp. NC0098]